MAKMNEMETLFTNNIITHISNEITGDVKATIYNDVLTVTIYSNHHKPFRQSYQNTSGAICRGCTSKDYAMNVLKTYKHFVLNIHFKKPNKK